MASEILQRNPTSTGNRKVHTWASWIKLNKSSTSTNTIYYCASSGANEFKIQIKNNGELSTNDYSSGAYQYQYSTNRRIRDYGSWFHLILAVDTTQGRVDDRFKFYVNGILYNGSYATENTNGGQNYLTRANTPGNICTIGQNTAGGGNYDANCQLSDVFMVDGQALTPDVFGFYKDGDGYISGGSARATDFRPGQWMPHAPSKIIKDINRRGGFGVNGFYLPMNDSSNPGADFHMTPNSIITLKGEDLPQPLNGAPTTSDAYVSELRSDPFAANLVYALPLISGGKSSGFGDYSNDIKGSGTAKTVSVVTYNSITPTITSGHSPYGSFVDYNSPAGTGGYIDVADSTAFDNINLTTAEWTFEAWFKRGALGSGGNLIQFGNTTDYQTIGINLHSSGRLWYIWSYNGTDWSVLDSTGGPVIPQDEWCHIAIVKEATPISRIVTYVNGVAAKSIEVTQNIAYTSPDYMRIGGHYRGTIGGGQGYFYDGGIFDARFYSTVKYNGGFDVPKPYTPVGIEAFRTVADTCKNNFCTWNSLSPTFSGSNAAFSNGNLTTSEATSNVSQGTGTIGPLSGKWYYEARAENVSGGTHLIGIRAAEWNTANTQNSLAYRNNGAVYNYSTAATNQATYTTGDIIGIAFDATNGRLWFSKNGVWTTGTNPSAGSGQNVNYTPSATTAFFAFDNVSGTQLWDANFGQNPSFCGRITAGTNADDSGKGLFKYAPPTGFLALCEDNLPAPAIADPGKHFKSVLYTGSQITRGIQGLGFKPDLVWIKSRSEVSSNALYDSVRGPTLGLFSNRTDAEETDINNLTSFDNNGFSLGSGYSSTGVNGDGRTYVAWCWKAGGAAVSNGDGSITSQVSVNQTAGFSIVKFTAQTSGTVTVGHGLGKKPAFWIYKPHTNTTNWYMYHQSLGASAWFNFTTPAATTGNAAAWGGVEPTSTVLTHGSGLANQGSCILYAWAEIEGYSKFGSYVGNGNADGPFVYCGFKPAFVLTKCADANDDWSIADSSRNSYNPADNSLRPNSSAAEDSAADIDILSNGFKIRQGNSHRINYSGETFIFAAFAESPFQTANAK
jgi:hypothetical protein